MKYQTIYVKANKKDYFYYDYPATSLGRYKRLLGATEEQLEKNIEKETALRKAQKELFSGKENIKEIALYWIDNVASKSPTSTHGLGLILEKKYKNICRNVIGNERSQFGLLQIEDVTINYINAFMCEVEALYEQARADEIYKFCLGLFEFTNELELTKIPLDKIHKPETDVENVMYSKAVLTEEEMQQIYNECFAKRRSGEYQYSFPAMILAIIIKTGCPYPPIANSKIKDFNFNNGTAVLGGREYVIDAKIMSVLKINFGERDKNENAFVTKRGTIVSANSTEAICRTLSEYLYIPYIRMGTIRYNYGRMQIEKGKSFGEIAYNMGYEPESVAFLTMYDEVIKSMDKEEASLKIASMKNIVKTSPTAMNYVLSLTEEEKNDLLVEYLIKDGKFLK